MSGIDYVPTPEERSVTLQTGDFLKLSGDGVFATLQGEGATTGQESVFLRLQGCNLHCGADGNGWPCDTWYTWDQTTPEFWQETKNVPVPEVSRLIIDAWATTFGDTSKAPNLVISGGEPLRQQKILANLLLTLPEWSAEIETNGTIVPDAKLEDCQINCSPKLASSGNSMTIRRRPEVLQRIAEMPNYWMKFVITSNDFDQDIAEVCEIVALAKAQPERVLLMPEGTDPETLQTNFSRLQVIAPNLGFQATQRMHVFWYGNKRGT